MNFKNITQKVPALKFLLENTPILSNLGEKELHSSPFYLKANLLNTEFDYITTAQNWYFSLENSNTLDTLIHSLEDFSGTLKRLKNGEILDDLDYFEIKKGALTLQAIKTFLDQNPCTLFTLESVQPVIHILDPENTQLPHFYIYSSYDDSLRDKRKLYDQAQDQTIKDQLFLDISQIEDQIRKRLSISLRQYTPILESNLNHIAHLDVWIAKGKLAKAWNCCRPIINNNGLKYNGLFHPIVKNRLAKENKEFQPVDINLQHQPTLITGANMSGKTILLKSVAFAQWMFQLGFFVPAEEAELELVEEILFSVGDQSSEMSGLSSFAFEILFINEIIKEVKKGRKLLILVDELARTTNPTEGTIFVNAFLEIMNQYPNFCLVTTHYSGVKTKCRRLRVKGLQINENNRNIEPKDLNQYMDYTLIEIFNEEVPQEAIKIAQILGVDADFLQIAQNLLNESKNN